MNDRETVGLFLKRDEAALQKAQAEYGAYCVRMANNILGDPRDAEECFSDALAAAWNSIPPDEPEDLGAYLARLTRNAAVDAWRRAHAAKRGSGSMPLPLDEAASSPSPDPEEALYESDLIEAINGFLSAQPKHKRVIFTLRYFRFESVADIAAELKRSPGSVSAVLRRLKTGLERYLKERGFEL